MSAKNTINIATSNGPRLYLNASSLESTRAATTAKAAMVKNGDGVFRVRKTSSGLRTEMPITTFPVRGKVPTSEGER